MLDMARRRDLHLGRTWKLGSRLGGGGFGDVYEAEGRTGEAAVAKLIPKQPAAERELGFDRLAGARNVVSILDSGETATHFAIVIAATTTRTGLKVRSGLDTGDYPKGISVSDQEMDTLSLHPDTFHGAVELLAPAS